MSGAFRPLPPRGSGQAFACQALELKATDGKGEQHGKMNERSWKWETYSGCLLERPSAFPTSSRCMFPTSSGCLLERRSAFEESGPLRDLGKEVAGEGR